MSMPTQTTPAAQLDQAEQAAQERIDEILAAAAAAGVTGAALAALLAALTGAVQQAAQAGWGVGAGIVLNGALGRRPRGVLVPEPLPTSVEADVVAVVVDAAAKIDRAPEGPGQEWERARRRLRTLAVVKIHQAASAATYSYASWLGLDLEWVTRRDGKACIVCTTMNGKRVTSGDKFANPRGPGIPRTLWRGFQGLPPAHPRCRCRVIPRT